MTRMSDKEIAEIERLWASDEPKAVSALVTKLLAALKAERQAYQDDLEAAVKIVLGAGGITGHADTFHSLTAEWADRMKAAEAENESLKLTLASREAARAQYLEEKLAAEAKLAEREAIIKAYEAEDFNGLLSCLGQRNEAMNALEAKLEEVRGLQRYSLKAGSIQIGNTITGPHAIAYPKQDSEYVSADELQSVLDKAGE